MLHYLGADAVSFARNAGPAVELGGGVSGRLTRLLSVHGNASYLTSVQAERNTTVEGNVGPRVAW